MEQWQKEIQKLQSVYSALEINYNRLEKHSGVNRAQLKRFFEMENVPSLKLFFQVKKSLEDLTQLSGGKNHFNKSQPAIVFFNLTCDCTLDESGLFRRGLSGCKKLKSEHKF